MEKVTLNPLLSDRSRLLIMAALSSAAKGIDFTTLANSLELSRGNLSVHARKLEKAGFIAIKKEFIDLKPRTTFRITGKGRKEVKDYLKAVEGLFKDIG